ncbi:hypothetical protein AMQ84_08175 [Paenibacillus riograndensis]|uniref:Carbamoyltransferase n=1 Tax=Paenibacillus riograndensis TaxID=483937 RepID=A0A132U6G4_9BACL|nr:carbamoyltransferase C-terminal domain-containing protein [Paenibacillus riograndensis]KWX78996.1 hypothetical protein AMQ84_08175 [Paenibacillus riograndensis]
MSKYILGLCLSDHDSSACLIKDNRILVAISKERLTRKKRHGCSKGDFDNESVQYCLDYAGISIDDVDLIVQNSIFTYLSDPAYYETLRHYKGSHDYSERIINMTQHPVLPISHHLAHAYSSYYLSPFDEAAILVIDSMGNEDHSVMNFFQGEDRGFLLSSGYRATGGWERESVYTAKGGIITPISKRFARDTQPYDSLIKGFGIMYHEVSEYIFGDGHKAGETMGLAPFGKADYPLGAVSFTEEGYAFNDEWLKQLDKPHLSKDQWNDRFEEFAGLAYQVQTELEDSLIHLCNRIHKETGLDHLCLAGGIALNSVTNKKILDRTPFKSIFIPPAAGDSGISIGCALKGYRELGGLPKEFVFLNDYLGKTYSNEEIVQAIENSGLQFRKSEDICKEVAGYLSEDQIIAWFQEGSEFGPRALGHRSILCQATSIEMRDSLNARVKFRQSFRPFAPSVMEEYAPDFFEMDFKSPFMLMVTDVKKDKADVVPGIVHVDGTARVQTVTEEENGIYYRLIKEYAQLTGIPLILNTSFNVNGEPIVETPADALNCYKSTNIDILVIGDYIISK